MTDEQTLRQLAFHQAVEQTRMERWKARDPVVYAEYMQTKKLVLDLQSDILRAWSTSGEEQALYISAVEATVGSVLRAWSKAKADYAHFLEQDPGY